MNKECKFTSISGIRRSLITHSFLILIFSSHTRQSGVAPSIPYDGLISLDTDLNVWQNRAAQLVQPKIEGNSALSHDPYLIRLWTPAPPKMFIHPRRIKERLFAQYTSARVKEASDDDDDEGFTMTGEQETIFTTSTQL
jgi:hypothetical protein